MKQESVGKPVPSCSHCNAVVPVSSEIECLKRGDTNTSSFKDIRTISYPIKKDQCPNPKFIAIVDE